MPESQMSDIEEKVWQFLRGDLPTAQFEQWVYDTPELETLCGPDLFLELISGDYRDSRAVDHIRDTLQDWVEQFPRDCDCITWKTDEGIPLGSEAVDFLNDFGILRSRTPWLDLILCVKCKSHWHQMQNVNRLDRAI